MGMPSYVEWELLPVVESVSAIISKLGICSKAPEDIRDTYCSVKFIF